MRHKSQAVRLPYGNAAVSKNGFRRAIFVMREHRFLPKKSFTYSVLTVSVQQQKFFSIFNWI